MSPHLPHEATAIGRAAADALRAADIPQREAAARTGIAMTTLTRRLSGHSPFRIDELAAIADLCGVSVADLVAPEDAA